MSPVLSIVQVPSVTKLISKSVLIIQVTYCTSCCRWDGFTRDAEGIWESGPRNDLCNMDNTAARHGAVVVLVLLSSFVI